MTGADESLGATLAATGQATTIDSGQVELRPPPPGAGTPVDKEIVKRALFPRRGGPVRIGRFTVLGQVGRGAMGVVYACYDDLLDRKVAVKLLKHTAAGDPSAAQVRLLREAQALARLDHPNVVTIHDVGTFEDRVYLAMEFVDGQTLGAWLTAAPRTWRDILAVVIAAGEGLAAAHAKGLVHRDIKPDNIMVGGDGRVRLMDFGLARAEASAAPPGELAGAAVTTALTHTGAIMGTPAFMAPEQFLGEPVDARSDQFALCATAWEALYGQRPFAGDDLTDLMASVTAGVIAPPPRARAPQWLRKVLERGLSRDPAARFADTRALLQALRADPTRRRRTLAAVAGALGLASAGVGAARLAEQRTLAGCEAAASAVLADWDEPARAALLQAFVATGAAHAAATFARTAPWLDRWATSWHDVADAACRAHRLDAAWDGEQYARAVDCLAEARGNFVALVGELRRVDAASLTEATSAAAALAAPELCADPAHLRERPMLRFDQREQVLAVRERLARAGSLAAAGRYAEGLPVAREARHAAAAVGWPALVAQAELRAAALAEQTGAYADAEAGLLRAVAAAREARSARLALQASTELVYVVGYRGSRLAEGKVWGEAARTQLALLAGAHPLEQADLDSNLAGLAYVGGDLGEAARLYARVLAAREAALGEQHPRVADSVNNLAGVRYATGAIDEAARLFARSLAIYEQVYGEAHPQVATTLNNISLVHEALGTYDQAIAALTRALAIREATFGPEHALVATSLCNLALVYEATGVYDEAARLFLRALAIQEKAFGLDHPMVADTLHNLATVRYDTHDHAESARLLRRALAIYERRLGPHHPSTVASVAGLGQVLTATGAPEEALKLFARALASQEQVLGPDHPSLAHSLLGRAEALTALGRAAEAVPALERALAIREASQVQPEELAEARFALARALWDGGDRPRARALAEQAATTYPEAPGTAAARAKVRDWLASHPAP
ncbi:Serine/threonine protein kinase [Nannocystis exedens]|uniref:Serine/threonine protein kinase n=1 Tax=Nannocystis exedens TaxID=54 RepID=A0A1I2CXD4_9BACT|nr:serine/threonine-protein kinase [Nannocystis exedens]PCC68639.1 Serine/threonine-protein kinase PrkC [Nannocystis exedens]SFE72855.1 Serine/threonine protein kinase [Nannocystis exedens]